MGYSTDFSGSVKLSRVLTDEEQHKWDEFIDDRHEGSEFPGYWCQWEVDGVDLQWDCGEKFYHYVEWMKYMIDNFIIPWGIIANGTIEWTGEENGDYGCIVVCENIVSMGDGVVRYCNLREVDND